MSKRTAATPPKNAPARNIPKTATPVTFSPLCPPPCGLRRVLPLLPPLQFRGLSRRSEPCVSEFICIPQQRTARVGSAHIPAAGDCLVFTARQYPACTNRFCHSVHRGQLEFALWHHIWVVLHQLPQRAPSGRSGRPCRVLRRHPSFSSTGLHSCPSVPSPSPTCGVSLSMSVYLGSSFQRTIGSLTNFPSAVTHL